LFAAALGHPPALIPYPEWTSWLRTHSWNDWVVNTVLGGLVVLGLLVLYLALRRGKPASLTLKRRVDGVGVSATRRSVQKSLAAAAARTNGIAEANASVGRRTARVDAQTLAQPEPTIREEVERVVKGRLDALDLQRPMRTRVVVTAKDAR